MDTAIHALHGPDVHITPADPDPAMLETHGCDRCDSLDCPPVAHVEYPVSYGPDEYAATVEINVGRACLPPAIDEAREHLPTDGQITVTVPQWSTTQAALVGQVTFRQLDVWCQEGWIEGARATSSTRQRVGHRRLTADAVRKVKRMGDLGRLDIGPRAAHRLLTRNDSTVVDGVIEALSGSEQVPA